jgi:hypothetical protein
MFVNEFYNSILANILSGIALILLPFFIKSFAIPWFRHITYRETKVSGKWDSYYSHSMPGKKIGKLVIKQKATKLSGIATVYKNREGQDSDRKFSFTGSYGSGRLVAFYEDKKTPGLALGTVYLTLDNNGKKMTGYTHYYNEDKKETVSEEVAYLKKGI